MTQEEKAEAYEVALEKAKSWYVDAQIDFKKSLETLFPELKESEEKIRKELLNHLKEASYGKTLVVSTLDYKRWADWLEKQGEQKEQLINKACDVLVNCIEDFMFRRMEIWNEECKKQTLENIRKTLEE